MRKYVVAVIGLILLSVVFTFTAIGSFSNTIRVQKSNYDKVLGKSVVIYRDTIKVESYDILRGTVKLEDGRQLSLERTQQLIIK